MLQAQRKGYTTMIVKHIDDPTRAIKKGVIKSKEPVVEKEPVKNTPDKEIFNNKKGRGNK